MHVAGLPHELVEPTVEEQAVPVLVDVDPVGGTGSVAVEEYPEGIGSPAAVDSTR